MECLRDRLPHIFDGPFRGGNFVHRAANRSATHCFYREATKNPSARAVWLTMQLQEADSNPKLKPGHLEIVCQDSLSHPLRLTSPSSAAKLLPPPGGGPPPP